MVVGLIRYTVPNLDDFDNIVIMIQKTCFDFK